MKILLVVAILFLVGCAGEINKKNADRYYQAALEAEHVSDYEHSKNMYYRSLVNARSGSASKQYISATLYGYGRMLGYTCDLVEAEAVLKESLILERASSGPASSNISKRLSELGRLSIAQGNYTEASSYFEEAAPILEGLGVLESDPIGYTEFLATFAGALDKSGKQEQASVVLKKAQQIKDRNVGVQAKFVAIHYGTNCDRVEKS